MKDKGEDIELVIGNAYLSRIGETVRVLLFCPVRKAFLVAALSKATWRYNAYWVTEKGKVWASGLIHNDDIVRIHPVYQASIKEDLGSSYGTGLRPMGKSYCDKTHPAAGLEDFSAKINTVDFATLEKKVAADLMTYAVKKISDDVHAASLFKEIDFALRKNHVVTAHELLRDLKDHLHKNY